MIFLFLRMHGSRRKRQRRQGLHTQKTRYWVLVNYTWLLQCNVCLRTQLLLCVTLLLSLGVTLCNIGTQCVTMCHKVSQGVTMFPNVSQCYFLSLCVTHILPHCYFVSHCCTLCHLGVTLCNIVTSCCIVALCVTWCHIANLCHLVLHCVKLCHIFLCVMIHWDTMCHIVSHC